MSDGLTLLLAYQLLPTHYPLPSAHYSLPPTYYPLLPTHHTLPNASYTYYLLYPLLPTHPSIPTPPYQPLPTHYFLYPLLSLPSTFPSNYFLYPLLPVLPPPSRFFRNDWHMIEQLVVLLVCAALFARLLSCLGADLSWEGISAAADMGSGDSFQPPVG